MNEHYMRTTPTILLIITGSIAAYKALELIRQLRGGGAVVRVILTASAEKFVTPLSIAALSEQPVYQDLFSLKDETEMGHIRLAREADIVLVAPASADFLARMAHGMANDLATATLLATHAPVYVAPAMNPAMWQHNATQRNIAQLQADGVSILAPEAGVMACGEEGVGRMAACEAICDIVLAATTLHKTLAEKPLADKPLAGRKAIVTSGGTQEAIDPVRYITNRSSGKQGHAIARALVMAGAEVTLVSAPVAELLVAGAVHVPVTSAQQMYDAVMQALPADIAICAAAVGDWRMQTPATEKMKKTDNNLVLNLVQNPDILHAISQPTPMRPTLVVGFAAETEAVLENAQAKHARKGCDWLLANDTAHGRVFGEDTTSLLWLHDNQYEDWGRMSKQQAAQTLVAHIINYFS